ncbi:hypothetical protein [Desulfopila sp. IMCC35008]|uniref:hypothetical protein n=1 Tax=Desulfopila sp. IMCC35008 TaxID=2653858 RepID=UPI0013D7F137|nr:hypothetical protein [Desulfopila sp. IMCC35008]
MQKKSLGKTCGDAANEWCIAANLNDKGGKNGSSTCGRVAEGRQAANINTIRQIKRIKVRKYSLIGDPDD